MLQVVSTIDAAIDNFKRNPVPLEMQAGAPQHQAPYQHPTAGATAVPGAYQDPQTAYPAAAGATAPYAGAAYSAAPYSHGQYGAYPQQPYQQPYAAAAAQGESVPPQAALPKKYMYHEMGLGLHLCSADHGWCTPTFALHGHTLACYAWIELLAGYLCSFAKRILLYFACWYDHSVVVLAPAIDTAPRLCFCDFHCKNGLQNPY